MNNCVVLGGTGFVGSKIAAGLGSLLMFSTSRAGVGGSSVIDITNKNLESDMVKAIGERSAPTHLILCSKFGIMDDYITNPNQSYELEVEATARLVEVLNNLGTKLVYLSTSYVFNGLEGGYKEQDEIDPISEYGKQKAEAEKIILTSADDYLILRLDKIVSSEPISNNLFEEWFYLAENKHPLICIENQVFSPTTVDDITAGVVKSVEQNLSGIYHHANPQAWKRADLAAEFLRLGAFGSDIIERPGSDFGLLEKRPLKSNLDSGKFISSTDHQYVPMTRVMSEFLANVKR